MNKCIIIIDENLDTGIIANVASILSLSIGNKIDSLIGNDITDKQGLIHSGLTQLPIPVLGANGQKIKEVITAVKNNEEILTFDFNNFSKKAKTYEEYISFLQNASKNDILYLGIALYGQKKKVDRVTKGLTLLAKK